MIKIEKINDRGWVRYSFEDEQEAIELITELLKRKQVKKIIITKTENGLAMCR
jgi:L-lactate utilization protein LutB